MLLKQIYGFLLLGVTAYARPVPNALEDGVQHQEQLSGIGDRETAHLMKRMMKLPSSYVDNLEKPLHISTKVQSKTGLKLLSECDFACLEYPEKYRSILPAPPKPQSATPVKQSHRDPLHMPNSQVNQASQHIALPGAPAHANDPLNTAQGRQGFHPPINKGAAQQEPHDGSKPPDLGHSTHIASPEFYENYREKKEGRLVAWQNGKSDDGGRPYKPIDKVDEEEQSRVQAALSNPDLPSAQRHNSDLNEWQ